MYLPILMMFKREKHQNPYTMQVRFSGSIYHPVLRQKIYCNTISEAVVDTGNFTDVQQWCHTSCR